MMMMMIIIIIIGADDDDDDHHHQKYSELKREDRKNFRKEQESFNRNELEELACFVGRDYSESPRGARGAIVF